MTSSLSNRRVLPAILVAAAAAALALPAATRAQLPAESRIVVRHVPIRDLDLAKAADVRTLHHRVARAVTQICGISTQADLVQGMLIDKCRRMAALSAAPQIAARIQHDTEYAAARATRSAG